MSIARIESMLKDAIGLDAESIGRRAVERAVLDRQRRCGIADVDAYWDYLCASPSERQHLIDVVIVPETWFFRDREAFNALKSIALSRHRAQPDVAIRLLSLPCASGEEAYSMAMALLDAGIPADRFRVHGVDVSERQIGRARNGLYGKSAFRGTDLTIRNRHFASEAGHYRVGDAVRVQVEFHHRSLFAADLVLPVETFDIIWCRNLLIYFDRPTQDAAVQILSRFLAPDGVLFVGSSEAGAVTIHGYESAGLPMAFAFRKRGAQPPAGHPEDGLRSRSPRRETGRTMLRVQKMPPTSPGVVRPFVVPPKEVDPVTELRKAEQLADAGRFDEAAACCEAYLRRFGPSADALYLQALVYDASGREAEAEPIYRKALYLNPQHREALVHLGLLLDRCNRTSDAQVVRQRLRRLGGNP
jgi:chemotaxis protein methyltransferase WspC